MMDGKVCAGKSVERVIGQVDRNATSSRGAKIARYEIAPSARA